MREARRRQVLAAVCMDYGVSRIGTSCIYPEGSAERRAQEFTFLMMNLIFVRETGRPLYTSYGASPDSDLDIGIYPDAVKIRAACHCNETGLTDKVVEFPGEGMIIPALGLNGRLLEETAARALNYEGMDHVNGSNRMDEGRSYQAGISWYAMAAKRTGR